MAMVAAVGLGSMQTHHRLVPVPTLTQGFGPLCHAANGQPLQLSHHFLSLVHGVKTLHPKHNLDLDLQRQYAAKRLVLGVDQSSAVHDDNSVKHGMRSLCMVLSYSWIPWTNPHLAPGLEVHPKKVYPWGAPPRVSSHGQSSHVISLHQSAPLMESLNHVARSV